MSLRLICAWLDIFVFNVVTERGKASLASLSLDQSERAQYTNCFGCLDCSLRLEVWKDEEGHLSMTSVLVSQEWCVGEAEGRWILRVAATSASYQSNRSNIFSTVFCDVNFAAATVTSQCCKQFICGFHLQWKVVALIFSAARLPRLVKEISWQFTAGLPAFDLLPFFRI